MRAVLILWLWAWAGLSCGRESAQQAVSQPGDTAWRTVVDMRGAAVLLPAKLERVVTVSDGLVETAMIHFGQTAALVGLGSSCVQRTFRYDFPGRSGEGYSYEDGMNPAALLYPRLRELPLIASSGTALNYESLASLAPQVLILRAGSCTLPSWEDEGTQKIVQKVEALGIPVVVLKAPPCYDSPTVEHISEELGILGEIFDRAAEARQLAAYLEGISAMIQARTSDIPEHDKPRLLLLGLSPKARASGGAGNTKGLNTIESYFIESIANARNAYTGLGGRSSYLLLSTEQIYALAPDVIVLPTASGYHPPEELYAAPYYQNLQHLDAVKQERVYALPWTPCNCAKRLEYPLEALIIAKAAYPERFEDIRIYDWSLSFYQELYRVDKAAARQIRSAQWLDWMAATNF
jgi:iron complex transport system substrate-binding protein